MAARAQFNLMARFALLPGITVLLLTALLMALAQWLLVAELERRSLLRVERRAAALAHQIDEALRAAALQLRLVARSPRLLPGASQAQARAELDHLQAAAPQMRWLGLVSPDGRVVVATRGWLEQQSVAARTVFQEGLRGGWVGDARPPAALASLLMADGRDAPDLVDMAEPVRDAEGRVVAVLAAHLGVDWVDGLRRVAGGERDGTREPGVTLHLLTGPAGRNVLAAAPPPAGLPLLDDPSGELRAADGRRYFAAVQALGSGPAGPLLPWRVLVLQERQAALQPAFEVMRSMVALGTLAALVLALAGYAMARHVLGPWHRLFGGVVARLQASPEPRSVADGVDLIARELAAVPSLDEAEPQALLARLARGALDLKRVIDHLPVGVALVDRDYRVQYLNPAYTRLLGWTTAQVRGRIAAEFLFDAADRAAFMRIFEQMGHEPAEVAARFDAVTPGGSRVAIEWHMVPMHSESGALEGSIALVHDIRGERAASVRADALAGRLRALADAAVDELLATLDLEGRVLEWSQGAEWLTGFDAPAALGQPFQALLKPGPLFDGWLLEARRRGRCPVAAELTCADGETRWFEGSVYALGLAPGLARFGMMLRDLTPSREVLRALERSEARLRLAVGAARMGTWEICLGDNGLHRMAWSDDYAETFGLPAARLPDSEAALHALMHADDREAVRDALQRTARQDMPLAIEFRLRHPQGLRWHALHGRAQRDAAGRLTRIMGIGMDITDRKLAEAAVSEGRELLERTIDTMAEGLVMFDTAGRFTRINQASQRMLGTTAAQVLGCHFEDVPWKRLLPDGSPLTHQSYPFIRLQQGDHDVRGLVMHIERPDGQRRVISLNAQPLRAADGSFSGALATHIDITERHLAEQALADSQARLSAIVQGASDAIVSTDSEGRISLFNPAAERIFGLAAASMLGQPLHPLLPEAARHGHLRQMAAFDRSGGTRRAMGGGHVSARRADGQALALEASISQAVVHGQVVLTAILRDVTERVAQERALDTTRAELAELTRRLLDQEKHTARRVAQALHDELGQTLTALRLHWEALQTASGAQAQMQRERVGRLVEAANRQIRGVLGELRPPLLDDFGLAAALDNEIQHHRPPYGPPALALEVPARLQQQRWPADVEYAAFMIGREALVNALHHAQAEHVVLRLEGDEGELRLGVHDDGVGLPTAAPPNGAAHLGLVGMRERALAIGGTLQMAASADGRGTSITLHWTLDDEPDLPGR